MKIYILLALTLLSMHIQAQDLFEGEIVYETHVNLSPDMAKQETYFGKLNGVHKGRLIVKGNTMLQVDETTHLQILYIPYADADKTLKLGENKSDYVMIYYCDELEGALVQEVEMNSLLSNRDLNCLDLPGSEYVPEIGKLKSYDFKERGEIKRILNKDCSLYSGTIVRNIVVDSKHKFDAWVDKSIRMPKVYSLINYGIDIDDFLALNSEYHAMMGHVMSFGEGGMYEETNVLEINKKDMDDTILEIPSKKKFVFGGKGSSIAEMSKYLKLMKKMSRTLEAIGEKALEDNKKTFGVHYKTEEEWDF